MAQLGYGLAKVFLIVWPMVVLKAWLREPVVFRTSSSMPLGRSLLEGGGLGLFLGAAIGLALLTPLGDVVAGSQAAIRDKARDLGVRDHFWLFAIFISFVHSLVEEYYWRGFVFGQLRQLRRLGSIWLAHVLAGLAFSLHHIVITTQFFPFVPGLGMGLAVGVGGVAWSLLYQRHGHLYGAWISHLIVDLVLMTIGAKLILD